MLRKIDNTFQKIPSIADPFLVFTISMAVQLVFWKMAGTMFGGDTGRYVHIASYWAGIDAVCEYCKGMTLWVFYNGYPLYLSMFLKANGNIKEIADAVIFGQIALSSMSIVFLYYIMKMITGSRVISLVFALLFSANFQMLNWVRFIMSDSFNLTYVIIATYFVVRAILVDKGRKITLPLSIILVILALFVRPTNLPFVAISLLALVLFLSGKNLKKIMMGALVCIVAAAAVSAFIYSKNKAEIDDFSSLLFERSIVQGKVISGRPHTTVKKDFDWNQAGTMTKTFFAFKVVFKKALYFWNVSVKGHSMKHLLVNAVVLIPLYILAMIALYRMIRYREGRVLWLFIMYIAAFTVFHALTFVDYDDRYRIVLMPSLFVLGAYAIKIYYEKKNQY